MPSSLNRSDVFTIKSRINRRTDTYDDSNNWNIVSACSVCTNSLKCKYNTPEIMSNGICLHFNYSNAIQLTNIYFDVDNPFSINRINKFKDSKK